MRLMLLTLVGSLAAGVFASYPAKTKNVQDVFDTSMAVLDTYYDPSAGYIYDFSEAALRHTVTETAWYALGLVMRNDGNDIEEAEKIINNLVRGQFKDKSKQWYGTYQKYPEEPVVGSDVYPQRIYWTWDPNWRGFVGTTFVMILEEYSDRISNETQELIVESLRHAVIGDTYRVGGVDNDNLYPGYSNPAIMRAFTSGWLGRRLNDENMTRSGEAYANEIIELFNITNTLSEFNSGTYTGISLFGLTLWSTYLPKDSVMAQCAPDMIRKTWNSVSELWHPGMRNLAGPWDRAYGWDMNRYFSIMGVWFWAYLGKEHSSLIKHAQAMTHSKDHAWAPVISVLADKQAALLPEGFFEKLKTFQGEHTSENKVYYPPYDLEIRNVSTWLSENLTIGAQSINQMAVGGPTTTAFTPAGVQWTAGDQIGFWILRPTEKKLQSVVSPGKLSLTYPEGTNQSVFEFAMSTFRSKPMMNSLDDIPNLKISVSGNVNHAPNLTFAGVNGGAGKPLQSFDVWIFRFSMPKCFKGKPTITLDFAV